MISRKQGKIVNISSIAGLRGSGSIAYVASKAGVIGITMSLAKELVEFGITVNAVAPGMVDTEMLGLTEEQRKNIKQEVPIGWIGRPEHIAHCVLFLVQNDYITGQVVNVSGGRLIGI
jgi:3-oxoacyl-[acyl-carrier protein] reductase